jgi:NitT/TauT family transport system ATP-binding protein
MSAAPDLATAHAAAAPSVPRSATGEATGAAPAQGALRIVDVVKQYGSGADAVRAVDHCSLDIAAGEICMIVGPSGCGKTSLLNAIAGFHDITSGRIELDGELLCGPGRPQATPGADRVVVFQNGALFPWKTTLDNVCFGPLMEGRKTRAEIEDQARAMMADAGLSGNEKRYPGELSSGVRRRVEIVRALMNQPKVLLFDEPYRALDSLTKSVMHESLLDIYYRNKVTIFFITHDLEEAVFLGHRLVVMTSRPCRPKRIVEVDIPHPRDYGVLTSPRFREIMEETSEVVHEEALKSFAAGEKEG